MTVVFVHGIPETSDLWGPLRATLDRETVAVSLPGFGTSRPPGFAASKDAYAEWLAEAVRHVEPPIDIVGHDVGALVTMRVATAFDVPLRSWVVDVPEIFHPRSEWPERVRRLQQPGVGEEMLQAARGLPADDPRSTTSRLMGVGVPRELAQSMGAAHDERMSQCILDFYRSAVPNVAAGWWADVTKPTPSRGLVLLLPDPPEIRAMSLEVARRLGAETASLGDLNHCWMAEAPQVVAPVLERFWSSQ